MAVLQEPADDPVLTIESEIESNDNRILARVQLEPMSDLRELVKSSGAAATSVFVLDDQLRLVPDGSVSTRLGKPGIEFRDKFLARILPELPLAKQPVGKRGHV